MEFHSLFFLFLFMPVYVGMMLLFQNSSFKNAVLALFSLLFYLIADFSHFWILLLCILFTWITAQKVRENRSLYIAYLAAVVLLLSFFKYGNPLFHTSFRMPLGLSFYLFTAVAYVYEVYSGKMEAEKDLLKCFCFLSFFLTVSSGPILRYGDYKDWLEERKMSSAQIAQGLRRFILGVIKKVLIANQLALVTDKLFAQNARLDLFLAVYALLSFMMQIYYDFSSYSDMAIGLAQMTGLTLKENFDHPYHALSIQDFWRRWHISLSSWFRDVVYIPSGGNRVSTGRWIFNTMLVWLLTGVWHGNTFNYLLWGIYNGILLILYRFLPYDRKLPDGLSWLITQALVLGGWLLFKISGLGQLKQFVKALLLRNGVIDLYYARSLNILPCLIWLFAAIVFQIPAVHKLWGKTEKKQGVLTDALLLLGFVLCVICIISGSYSAFIYFEF